jgi:hypothetical protein
LEQPFFVSDCCRRLNSKFIHLSMANTDKSHALLEII